MLRDAIVGQGGLRLGGQCWGGSVGGRWGVPRAGIECSSYESGSHVWWNALLPYSLGREGEEVSGGYMDVVTRTWLHGRG